MDQINLEKFTKDTPRVDVTRCDACFVDGLRTTFHIPWTLILLGP